MATETDIANRALSRVGHGLLVGVLTDTADVSKARRVLDAAYLTVRDETVRLFPWNCLKRRASLTGATVVGITKAVGVVVTTFAAHNFRDGEKIVLSAVEGMTEISGNEYYVDNATPFAFNLADDVGTLLDTSGSGFTAYSGPGDGYDTGRATLRPMFGYDQMFPLPADYARGLDIELAREPWVIEDDRILSDESEILDFRYVAHPAARTATDPTDYRYDALLISVMAARLAAEIVEELTQSNTKRQLAWSEYEGLVELAREINGQEESAKPIVEDDWLLARY